MNYLYIDFTNGAIGTDRTVKYHGGGDFCRFITTKINEKQQSFYKVIIILKSTDSPKNEEEINLFKKVETIKTNSILNIDYSEGDILFLPLIDCFQVNIISAIKKRSPQLRVYCVLHGLRLIDLSKYDRYDKYYYSGIKHNDLYLWSRRRVAVCISKLYLWQYLSEYDRVYTVSNNSLQQIVKYGKPKYIKYFVRDITRFDEDAIHDDICDGNFALFINANRYEKNFIRTLIAFSQYVKDTKSSLKLHVTGAPEEFQKRLEKVPGIEITEIDKHTIFHDYLTHDALEDLYRTCSFLLYTSKSEGYGLPPLEAMNLCKPTVASRITSIPEVLGFSAYYVDPYSIDSIKKGIAFMDDENNRKIYASRLKAVRDAIQRRGNEEIDSLVDEILS